jgi:hypothetical protein
MLFADQSEQLFGFIGWYRPNRRQPWRPVVQSDDERDCLSKLLNELPGDKLVLPAGRDPNQRE